MFSTAWKNASAIANRLGAGSSAFSNIVNALYDDANYAIWTVYLGNDQAHVWREARLILDNVIIGTNQATNQSLFNTTWTVGSTSNTFGTTLTGADVRKNTFGFAISLAAMDGSKTTEYSESQYAVFTGIDFAEVPSGATIVGVEIRMYGDRQYSGPGIEQARLGYAQIKLHYTFTIVEEGQGASYGYLEFDEQVEPQISQKKHYQYLAYENNEFRGEWKDVTSEPSLLNAVNELPGDLTVQLARNLDSKETEYEEIELSGYDEGDLLVTTQNEEPILGAFETEYGIGTGTDLEVDHTVNIKEYYGGYEGLLTSDGELLLTSQLEPLVVPVGYPRGRMYYRGYVVDYGLIYEPDNTSTEVLLYHLADELNNEIYKTPDTLKLNSSTPSPLGWIDFGGFFKYEGDNESAAQTFTSAATYKLKRIGVSLGGWQNNIITLTLRTGTTIGAGTVLGIATVTITDDLPYDSNILSFSFADAVQITNGQGYHFDLQSQYTKQTGSQSHPARAYLGPTYASGAAFKNNNNGIWVDTGLDLSFQLWEEGGNTRVNELSIDPSDIKKKILDYNVLSGGLITYTNQSIEQTNTIVSAPFNANTLKDGMDYVLKLAPSNWYYYIDPGDLFVNFKSRPEVVSHYFTLRKDIIRLKLHKSIEKLVNEAYFTGGGDPALFRSYVDAVSRAQWRKGLGRFSDNRVTDDDTADIVLQSEVETYSQPIWLGTLEVLRAEHPTVPQPGQLAGFRAFGNLIDFLELQMMSVDVRPDKFVIQLGMRKPKTSKRIEDIKRNLTRIELENNPSAPE